MGLQNRPYVGSWRLGHKQLVQHTPDALIYINGDVSVPGCPKCNGKIDIQQFVTEVSVDAGCEPGAMSASFTLSVPVHHHESFARDARFILRPGLEVHIYYRGYFPVKGLYSNLDDPRNTAKGIKAGDAPIAGGFQGSPTGFPSSLSAVNFDQVPQELIDKWRGRGLDALGGAEGQWATICAGSAEVIEQYWKQQYPNAWVEISDHHRGPNGGFSHPHGAAIDYTIHYTDDDGNRQTVPALQAWAGTQRLSDEGRLPHGGQGLYINGATTTGTEPDQQGKPSNKKGAPPGGSSGTHYDFRGAYGFKTGRNPANWVWVDTTGKNPPGNVRGSKALAWLRKNNLDSVASYYADTGKGDSNVPEVGEDVPNLQQILGQVGGVAVGSLPAAKDKKADPSFQESLLDEVGLAGFGLEDVLAYPYYHVFRGVVTQVGHSYSTGVQTISVQCASLLHFWQYHRVSTNASLFGARPLNSKLKASIVGHNFTGMHPYEIMYTLHHDTAGSAAGVAWALQQKTNQAARSPVTGESLFSLNIKYWEQRFNTKEIKLRMHGVTGELFSAAQAAFLGQTSSNQLTRLMRGRFSRKPSNRNQILQSSIALGLTRNRRLEALVAARQSRADTNGKANPNLELNMIEMQAFVSNIGNWGNFNLFESTYESKMDIAQRVMEVTGFEFFQDVDGDLVFKPPMYNLDTSSSRVYRIEDIDIININFNEQEPQVTYMTCKGSGIKNTEGAGLEGEWGVQGQYIDYRLVAQFGWRPGDFETAYFADPKSMFFAAINRLDVMNAPMNGASLTIPLRPEIRPGYPFYIQYLDCFYYCPSFAHSYSVGSQCTTSLTLTAKRAKFYAPGSPSMTGIEAIDLSNPIFPQRPLGILDNAGRPRLSGFPNVVMALDMTKLNPLFLIVGSDVTLIDNPDSLANLVERAKGFNIIRPPKDEDIQKYNLTGQDMSDLWVIDLGEIGTQLIYFQNPLDKSRNPKKGSSSKPSGVTDLKAAAQLYVSKQELQGKRLIQVQNEASRINDEINEINKKLQALDRKDFKTSNDFKKKGLQLENQVANLETKRAAIMARYQSIQQDFSTYLSTEEDIGIRWISELIKRMGEAYAQDYEKRGSKFGSLTTTTTLLDLLANKKAAMIGGNIPGDFRYYSASHPDKTQQGQLQPVFKSKSPSTQGEQTDQSNLTYKNPFLEALWRDTPVPTFVPSDQILIPPGAKKPEAMLIDRIPEWGIRVLTNNPDAPKGGEVLPTSEIREIMFASHDADIHRRVVNTERRRTTTTMEILLLGALQKSLLKEVQRVRGWNQAILDVFDPWYTTYSVKVSKAAAYAKSKAGSQRGKVPEIDVPIFPSSIVVGGTVFNSLNSIGISYLFSDSPTEIKNSGVPEAWPTSSKTVNLRKFWERAAIEMGRTVYDQLMAVSKCAWFDEMQSRGVPFGSAERILSIFERTLAASYKAKIPSKQKSKKSQEAPRGFQIQTPVFPVSDAAGYEVIGSYRYGRDVDIEANGVFDVLHRQDPFSVLDKHTMDLLLKAIVKRQGYYAEVPVTDSNGNVKTDAKGNPVIERKFVSGPEAYNKATEEIISQLRDTFTDKQLLDLEVAIKSGDPNMLQMNMMNWFSDKGKEGIQKLPINNAAYSLADMSLHTSKRICSCKMAEAEVVLDAAGQNDFLNFTAPANQTAATAGTGYEDSPTQWLMAEVARTSVAWKQSQDALRGTVPDNRESTLISTGRGVFSGSAFDNQVQRIAALSDSLEERGRALQDQAEALVVDSEAEDL